MGPPGSRIAHREGPYLVEVVLGCRRAEAEPTEHQVGVVLPVVDGDVLAAVARVRHGDVELRPDTIDGWIGMRERGRTQSDEQRGQKCRARLHPRTEHEDPSDSWDRASELRGIRVHENSLTCGRKHNSLPSAIANSDSRPSRPRDRRIDRD